MCLSGNWVQIYSFKHNGKLHRCWDKAYILLENEEYIVTATKKTRVIEADGRRWYTHEPAITFFSKVEWFNAICMLKEDGICYYCNIASPTVFDDNKIKYIDYDLDLKLYPDGNIRILDEKEYEKHRNYYDYSDELDKVLKMVLRKIYKKMENGMKPFVDEDVVALFAQFKKETGEN